MILEQLQKQGFVVINQLFEQSLLDKVLTVIRHFHQQWQLANQDFYRTKAINSAGLTSNEFLDERQRLSLFQFISQRKLLDVVEQVIPEPAFLNTQLFFDPCNPEQKNYWHRDIQYGNCEAQQKHLLSEASLMPHFRIPLADEQGIELIPGSHNRWDSEDELAVRTARSGRHCYEDLSGGEVISLKRGDLLIFSAKMLHRGIYGNKRFALDVLYADIGSEYLNRVPESYLPDPNILKKLTHPSVFVRTLNTINGELL